MIGNSGGASGSGHSPFDNRLAGELLDKLSSDDSFRESFASNPVNALAQLGYPAATDAMAGASSLAGTDTSAFACMQVNTLASKEEFAASRDELLAHLTSMGNHTVVFAFEANSISDALRRK